MQKPGNTRETPSPVAGLGVIRVSVRHKDNSSHLILQGLARVELEQAVRYKPYRVQRIRLMETPPCDSVTVDALLVKVRELLRERVELDLPFPSPFSATQSNPDATPTFSVKEILNYLDSLTDPEQTADLVSCAVLPSGADRQAILETLDVEGRLRRLIHFLLAEIRRKRKGGTNE
jgi:ATP-dependent Lon protease